MERVLLKRWDSKEAELIEVEKVGLETYYSLIGCNLVDVVCYQKGQTSVDIWCDDEFWLSHDGSQEDSKEPSVIITEELGTKGMGNAQFLFGNVVICGHDDDGASRGLTDEELELATRMLEKSETAKPMFMGLKAMGLVSFGPKFELYVQDEEGKYKKCKDEEEME